MNSLKMKFWHKSSENIHKCESENFLFPDKLSLNKYLHLHIYNPSIQKRVGETGA